MGRIWPLVGAAVAAGLLIALAGGRLHEPGAVAEPLPGALRFEAPRVQIEQQPVYQGCNDIVVHADVGTSWREVVAHFSDPASVYAVWHYVNDLQRYQGIYFADRGAPVDGGPTTTEPAFAVFACVSHDGTVG